MNVRAALSAALGLLMVAASCDATAKYGVPVAIYIAALVLVGSRYRAVATLAVVSAIGVLALGNTPAVLALLAGLAGAAYLLTVYPLRWPSEVIAARYEVIMPALVFGCAALLATALPAQESSWLPLMVPVAVVLIYAGVLRPFLR
ncbi:hypothetical protein FZI91_12515 [Mycobacterium sp. CBMA271]|uniref:hypothetical protein n=1 Tax=unclassified Mycobacteroides TaxID=2618759 RepID=UPI00132C5DD3|nr:MULTISPECIES: hypothetical protein [unclassified Mycobacteroides]MUM15984.1 hypothetical protein [Mycobacteroides sp. CBMA 326]MUM22517.1 hypothetical protein [Mycobacteroides sp. CBMA 271]